MLLQHSSSDHWSSARVVIAIVGYTALIHDVTSPSSSNQLLVKTLITTIGLKGVTAKTSKITIAVFSGRDTALDRVGRRGNKAHPPNVAGRGVQL